MGLAIGCAPRLARHCLSEARPKPTGAPQSRSIQADSHSFIGRSGIDRRIKGRSRDVTQGRGGMMSADSPEQTIMGQVQAGKLLDGLNEVLVDGVRHGSGSGSMRMAARQACRTWLCVSSARHIPTSLDCKRSGIWQTIHSEPKPVIGSTLACRRYP